MASFWKAATLRSVLLGACASITLATPAHAQEQQQIQFSIAAQDTASALNEFSRQAGVQILFPYDVAARTRAPTVEGSFTRQEALNRLLQGSPLRLASDDGRTIVLQDPSSPTRLDAADRAASSYAGEEEIIVTGTRIRGSNAGGSPTYVFDREDIENSGAASVQQLFSTLPQNFAGGTSETAASVQSIRNGGGNNVTYANSINLRGLGVESTLVLMDGRRLAPAGFGAAVDVSAVPLGALQRIEIVPDGASAIYGSDAVGGVVNFVLRDDYEGAETRVRYGAVADGDLRQASFNQLIGAAWDSGSLLVNFNYSQNEPLLASDRPYAVGLQTGVTYLSPSSENLGVLIRGRLELTPDLTLSVLAQGNARDAVGYNYVGLSGQQLQVETATSDFSVTGELAWDINDAWTLTLARTESASDTDRTNQFFTAATGVLANRNEVHPRTEVGATELELEGALFTIAGGDVRVALGAEQREETMRVRRVNFPRGPLITDKRDVSAAYAEVFVPVIGAGNTGPLAHELSFTLAGRYEDYSDVGDAQTYKFGGVYQPFDGVSLRGSYGTSFRAPYLYQYDQSIGSAILFNAPNPASSTGTTLTALLLQSADPDLGPENATTWTTGFDIDPSRLFGIRLSATYFDIAYEDRITAARATTGVFLDPLLQSLISIPPDPVILAQIAALPSFTNLTTQPLSAAVATYDARIRNQARTDVRGIDLTLGREFDTSAGQFGLGFNASYLLAFEAAQTESAPSVDVSDTIFNPVDLRARAYLTWASGGWSASAFVNYTDEYTDNQLPTAPVTVDSWTTMDLGVSYRFSETGTLLDGLTLRANAVNVFDENPPIIIDRGSSYGSPGYDTENANPIGRLVSFEIVKTW